MTNKQKQCLLVYLGYYAGDIDGKFGPQSVAATTAFQAAYGLDPDGKFGPATEARIREVISTGEEPQAPEIPADLPSWWVGIKYFRRDEKGIACTCGRCGGFPVEPTERLMRLADRVRDLAGAPAHPSSTVRCQAHNDELTGSSQNSRHLSGRAMDFCIEGWTGDKLLSLVKQQPEVNYAYHIYSNGKPTNYVHMDVD